MSALQTIDQLEQAVMSDTATESEITAYWEAVREVCLERGNHFKMVTSSGGQDYCFECGQSS